MLNTEDFAQAVKDAKAKYVVFFALNGSVDVQFEMFQTEEQKDFWLTSNSSYNIMNIIQIV